MPLDVIITALLPGVPKEILLIIVILTLVVTTLMTYREEIFPVRRAYNKEKKRLELLKLWYEVRSLAGDDPINSPPLHLLAPDQHRASSSPLDSPLQAPLAPVSAKVPFYKNNFNLFLSFGFMILVTLVMNIISQPLITPATPNGILSLQLAGSIPVAEAILASWPEKEKMTAVIVVMVDFIYVAAYSLTFFLFTSWAKDRFQLLSAFMTNLGTVVTWGIFGAAVMDVIDNIALLVLLMGNFSAVWITTNLMSNYIKFLLISIAMLYILCALMFSIWKFTLTTQKQGR
jgi:hypothetical protein